MPIEFPCPECSSLLRTPDDSSGKKAKCPNCGAISDVPLQRVSVAEDVAPFESPGDPFAAFGSSEAVELEKSANPFAEPAESPFPLSKPGASENPYATPAATAEFYSAGGAPAAALTPTRIGFTDTLQATWRVYTTNLGFLVLLALLLIGLTVLAYLLVIGVGVGFFFAVTEGNVGPAGLVIGIPLVLALAIGALFVYSWIEAGLVRVTVGLARGVRVEFSDVFSGGPYVLQVVLLNVLRAVISFAISIPFQLIASLVAAGGEGEALAAVGSLAANVANYIVTLLLLLSSYFIVDRNLDAIQAMGASVRFMRGNKLTVFAIQLVAGICSLLAIVLTCGLGSLLVLPFWLVLTAVMYLTATGQPLARYAWPEER